MSKCLGDFDSLLVHEFDGDRYDASADHRRHCSTCFFAGVEAKKNWPSAFRLREDAQGGLGDNAQLAFRANHEPEQIKPGVVHRVAADLENLAIYCDKRHA